MRRVGERSDQADADRQCFEFFYREHYQRVRCFVSRRVQPSDVDDLLVDTFSTAARRWDSLPGQKPEQIAWLLVTARHLIGNHHRAGRRAKALRERLALLAPTYVDDGSVADPRAFITNDAIESRFRALSNSDQLVLTLVAWDECTPAELGAILGCAPGAAKTRLARARARFRASVDAGRHA